MDVENRIINLECVIVMCKEKIAHVEEAIQEVKNELQRHYPKSERTKEISDTLL